MTKIRDIEQIMGKARTECQRFIAQSEDKFIEDVTASGALTFDEALTVVSEHREMVLRDSLEENMAKLRAWLERGATDLQ